MGSGGEDAGQRGSPALRGGWGEEEPELGQGDRERQEGQD